MKAVFHLDMDETPILELCLANVTNFLNDVTEAKVALLANGYAVKLFVRAANPKLEDRMRELSKRGVRFFVCNNALTLHGINREDVFDFCEVVPAGVTKLVELQNEGYAYIKP
jgi:intracellular sulfur oxidation DsrE/DsrF family protein